MSSIVTFKRVRYRIRRRFQACKINTSQCLIQTMCDTASISQLRKSTILSTRAQRRITWSTTGCMTTALMSAI